MLERYLSFTSLSKGERPMNPHKLTFHFLISLVLFTSLHNSPLLAQKRKVPHGGRLAIVVDERLAALRVTPQLTGKLVRRIGRGRMVAVRTARTSGDGIVFLLVNVNSRTHGWIQREAVVLPSHATDDQKLLELIRSSGDFDRIARARIFLEYFPHSLLRPEILMLFGDTAEELSERLSREASRRVNTSHGFAPEFSYFLNYSGLDRYNRQGVFFIFDSQTRRFHYNGAAWREILRRFPSAPEAREAEKRLAQVDAAGS
jgi:hypothetical protein